MFSVSTAVFYIFIFLSTYAQVFFLFTFLENRKKIITRAGQIKLKNYNAVTIIVPAFNEENTISKTVHSLLDLNYSKDKVKIFLVDDGSTDGTWDIIQKFVTYPNIKVFRKENGGKYTALNLGLQHLETDFLGCLDADSFVDRESLVRIMSYFEADSSIMAVAPSVTVSNPKNILQNAQKAEYHMGVYLKKMLSFMGAINVTPGPLTIFKKKVFNDLGPYRHGHNTEDMEIAYRMQKNDYKIEHCHDAYVYTNTPRTIKKLFRQRLRWIYGFINNTIDYRDVILQKKYGNFSIFTLPMGIITIFSVSYLFGRIVYNTLHFLFSKFFEFQAVGLESMFNTGKLDFFFLNIQSSLFMVLFIYCLVIFSMLFGRKMAEGKWKFSLNMFYFFPIFALIAPFWILKAIYHTAISRAPAWR